MLFCFIAKILMIMNFSPLQEKLESLVRYVLSHFYAVLSFDFGKKKWQGLHSSNINILLFIHFLVQPLTIHTVRDGTRLVWGSAEMFQKFWGGWYLKTVNSSSLASLLNHLLGFTCLFLCIDLGVTGLSRKEKRKYEDQKAQALGGKVSV